MYRNARWAKTVWITKKKHQPNGSISSTATNFARVYFSACQSGTAAVITYTCSCITGRYDSLRSLSKQTWITEKHSKSFSNFAQSVPLMINLLSGNGETHSQCWA